MVNEALRVQAACAGGEVFDQFPACPPALIQGSSYGVLADEEMQGLWIGNAFADEERAQQPARAAFLAESHGLGRVKVPRAQAEQVFVFATRLGASEKCPAKHAAPKLGRFADPILLDEDRPRPAPLPRAPFIATRVGGMIDYFEEGVSAIGYEAGNVEELRQKIRTYLDNPGQFAHIGRQSPAWVRPFSAEEFARTLLRIAAQLCPEPRTAASNSAHAVH